MKPLQDHGILRQSARLVGQQVRNPAEFFGNSRTTNCGSLHSRIFSYRPGVEGLAHVQVYSQTGGNKFNTHLLKS